MKYDGIIFDLDGTLWNSTDTVYDSWVKTIKTIPEIKHIHTKEEQMSAMGLTAPALMEKLFPELPESMRIDVFNTCCKEENAELREKGGTAYPRINETLEKLMQEHPLFIVSNCNIEYIDTYFYSMGTRKYFKDWESYGNTNLPKSENIKLVVERNHLLNPVYVGDTIWDKEAADGAGVPFIHAAYGFGTAENCPEINKPSELTELV